MLHSKVLRSLGAIASIGLCSCKANPPPAPDSATATAEAAAAAAASDAEAAAAEGATASPAAQALPARVPAAPRDPPGFDAPTMTTLRSGLILPLGLSMADFQSQVPDTHCQNLNGGLGACEGPVGENCPSSFPCGETSYEFEDQHLVGFSAVYDQQAWQEMMESTRRQFGEPQVIVNELFTASYWKLDSGYLSFMEFTSTAYDGSAVANPYSVLFGPGDPGSKSGPARW
jgi:hypothetical protein